MRLGVRSAVRIVVMRTLHPDNLDTWLSEWRRGLDDPEELFVELGLPVNVVQAALGELERRYRGAGNKKVGREGGGWERRVLGYLEQLVKAGVPTVELVRAEHPDVVDELERLLDEERYDLELIYPILEHIKDSPSATTVRDAIVGELLGEGARLRLAIFARLLARYGLRNSEVRPLKDLPKRALASSYLSLLVEPRLEGLIEDPELNAAVSEVWGDLLGKAADSPRVAAALDPEPASVLDVLRDDFGWRSGAYSFLEEMRGVWVAVLQGPAALREDSLRALGRETLLAYARTLARRVLLKANPPRDEATIEPVRGLGRLLHDRLAAESVFATFSEELLASSLGSWRAELYPRNVEKAAAESVVWASARCLADEVARRFASGVPEPQLLALGGRLAGPMLEARGDGSTPEELNEACGEVLARKHTHRELGHILGPLSADILGLLRDLTGEARATYGASNHGLFWSRWKDLLAEKFETLEYLPWGALDEDGLRRVFGEVVERLTGSDEDWQVVFRVGGFGPLGHRERVLRVGDVTFYDGRTHDYGEGRWAGEGEPDDEPAAYARVRVSAQGELAAERTAQRSLNNALDVLTFVYAARRAPLGFKPEILQGVHISRESGGATRRSRLRGTRTPVPLRVEDRETDKFAEVYSDLLAAAQRGEVREGERGSIRPGFLRAVRWYAKGYWEPDPVQRFLTHWIGLEHLFVGGEGSKKAVVDEVPKLTVSWRALGSMRSTGMTIQEVRRRGEEIAALEERADKLEVLEGWREDPRVLLDPSKVRVFTLIASEHDPELASLARRHADELRSLAHDYEAVKAEVEGMREMESFRVLLLYHLRNKIVHEAIPYVPDVEVYADKAEQILATVLETMADDAIVDTPENEFMEQLLAGQEEQPWLRAVRGMPVTDEAIETLRRAKGTIMGGRVFENDSTDLLNEGREERSETF